MPLHLDIFQPCLRGGGNSHGEERNRETTPFRLNGLLLRNGGGVKASLPPHRGFATISSLCRPNVV